MRVLVYSDVHANLEALEAVAERTAGGYDTSLCLGDLVGYGANPNETTAWVRSHTPLVIRGNHDRACAELHGLEWFNHNAAEAARWTHRALESDHLAWLAQLPPGPVQWNGIELVHGSPLDEDQYVVGATQARPVFAATAAPLHFFGHTHLQGGFVLGDREGQIEPIAIAYPDGPAGEAVECTLALEPGRRYLINPGSVGQPRDGDWRAAYCLYDTEARQVTFFRAPYAIEQAQAKIRDAGLPPSLATRLARGR